MTGRSLIIATIILCSVTSCLPGSGANSTQHFPDDFLWGTASSAYQSEGSYSPFTDTVNSNWSRWSELGEANDGELNLRGSDFYNRFAEDINTHVALGLDTIRLEVNWARIEPRDNDWDQREIDHYVEVVRLAQAQGLRVMVTFWHWVVPLWIADPSLPVDNPNRDQFAVPGNEWLWDQFAEFVAKVTPSLAPYVDLYSVVNEPWSMILGGYLAGIFPPGDFLNDAGMLALNTNLIYMHARAASQIRLLDTIDADGDGQATSIGMAKLASHATPFEPDDPNDVAAVDRFQYTVQQIALDAWTSGNLDVNWDGDTSDLETIPPEGTISELAGSLDWIGINYYGMLPVRLAEGTALGALPLANVISPNSDYAVSEFGSELRAAGFVRTLMYFSQWGLPLYITENGVADCDDNQRPRYLTEHLYALARLLNESEVDVRGYYQWSLTDNFEWAEGTEQCFGLYGLDPTTLDRVHRPSVDVYQTIVNQNGVSAGQVQAAIEQGYGGSNAPPFSLMELDAELDAEIGIVRSPRQ